MDGDHLAQVIWNVDAHCCTTIFNSLCDFKNDLCPVFAFSVIIRRPIGGDIITEDVSEKIFNPSLDAGVVFFLCLVQECCTRLQFCRTQG